MLIVNLWSDGGLWSGNLTVGESVYLGIEWIELAYNLTGEAQSIQARDLHDEEEIHILTRPPFSQHDHTRGQESLSSQAIENMRHSSRPEDITKREKTCNVVCRIDDVKHAGIPEII
jgi:hypothetical protein